MMMVVIKFKPEGKEYLLGVPEDYKGKRQIKPGSLVRVPVNGGKKKALFPVVRVVEVDVPPEKLKMIGYPPRQLAQNYNRQKRRAAHQGGIIYLAKGYDTDEGLPKLRELRLAMRMGFDESAYDDPTLPLHIIKKRRVHQLRDWAREQGLLPPMYYEDPIHGITKDQLRELLIGMANGIMPDTYGLKLIKLHKCAPRVLREMRLCREAGMTGDQIRPYWALGLEKLREVRAAFLQEQRGANVSRDIGR